MDPDDRKSGDPDAALRDLEERLKQVRRAQPIRQEQQASKVSVAFRFVAEMVAGMVVGGGIGWGLDSFFGTAPFLLIVMLFVGIAAGTLNVVRTAREMNEKAGSGE